MLSFWTGLSWSLGWTYTIIWSLSFYPQIWINYRRKSTTGLSMDFLCLNPIGFACLTVIRLFPRLAGIIGHQLTHEQVLQVYSVALYASPAVRAQYAERHDGHFPQVQTNDIAFAGHALVLSLVILSQTLVYKRGVQHQLSRFHRTVILLILSTIAIALLLAWSGWLIWLDFVILLSLLKLYVTAAKMVPQAWYNYQRKSTVGWSIENIVMDMTGGILSLCALHHFFIRLDRASKRNTTPVPLLLKRARGAGYLTSAGLARSVQLVTDSALDHDWRGITGNPGKLGLSFLALGFDTLFLIQHFILYRGAEHEDESDEVAADPERDRLIQPATAA